MHANWKYSKIYLIEHGTNINNGVPLCKAYCSENENVMKTI